MRGRACVVGAGILGLAAAWHLRRADWDVVVVDKDPYAREASVRNFGMVWPIGQPDGPKRKLALVSRDYWLTALEDAGLWHDASGSLHVFTDELELQVAREWLESLSSRDGMSLVSPDEIRNLSPLSRSEAAVGGLWSAHEVCVDPRQVIAGLARHLVGLGVEFRWNTLACTATSGELGTSSGTIEADLIVICPGATLAALYPDLYRSTAARLCRLHMLRAFPCENAPDAGTLLCSGLTLLHYSSFANVPSLPALRDRLSAKYEPMIRCGIHGLVSRHGDGSLTLGDSHEYGHAFPPYEDASIDALMVEYLNTFIDLSQFEVRERWTGVYCQSTTELYASEEPEPGVVVIGAAGGAGMTLSFGITGQALGTRQYLDNHI